MVDFVRNVAIEQRRRVVGAVMDHFDKKIAPALPANVRSQIKDEFREKLYQSVGQYHDFVLDCLKASISEPSVINEKAVELLQDIHSRISAMPRG